MHEYTEYLTSLGLDGKTIAIYRSKLAISKAWAIRQGIGCLVRLDALQARQLAEQFPFTSSTRRQLRTALRHYWEWKGRPDPPLRAIPVPKKPHYVNRALSREQARHLAKASLGWMPQGLAVQLGLYLALRVSEIARAEWSRFDGALAHYTVLGKGSQTWTLPVHPVLQEELMRTRRSDPRWLFPGRGKRAHVTEATVWNWVREVASSVGIEGLQTHQLRHTAITEANDRTGDLRTVSEFARHLRLETTRLYTRTTEEQLQRVVNAIDYFSDE